jgi:NDP-sugar pyrophosphorylase family protein
VTGAPTFPGGVLAAGEGRRLRRDGYSVPKVMVPVAGVPLIEHVVGNFVAAGVTPISLLVSEEASDGARWVRTRFPSWDIRVLTKTTRSSLESFQELAREAPTGPALISTVDAWCPVDDFARFVASARRYARDATVLAVTPFVADERPLWITLDGARRVTRIDDSSGMVVTAGIYLVSEPARRMALEHPGGRLRDFLRWIVECGEPVYGLSIPVVVDVDRAEDVELAEALAERLALDVHGRKGASS